MIKYLSLIFLIGFLILSLGNKTFAHGVRVVLKISKEAIWDDNDPEMNSLLKSYDRAVNRVKVGENPDTLYVGPFKTPPQYKKILSYYKYSDLLADHNLKARNHLISAWIRIRNKDIPALPTPIRNIILNQALNDKKTNENSSRKRKSVTLYSKWEGPEFKKIRTQEGRNPQLFNTNLVLVGRYPARLDFCDLFCINSETPLEYVEHLTLSIEPKGISAPAYYDGEPKLKLPHLKHLVFKTPNQYNTWKLLKMDPFGLEATNTLKTITFSNLIINAKTLRATRKLFTKLEKVTFDNCKAFTGTPLRNKLGSVDWKYFLCKKNSYTEVIFKNSFHPENFLRVFKEKEAKFQTLHFEANSNISDSTIYGYIPELLSSFEKLMIDQKEQTITLFLKAREGQLSGSLRKIIFKLSQPFTWNPNSFALLSGVKNLELRLTDLNGLLLENFSSSLSNLTKFKLKTADKFTNDSFNAFIDGLVDCSPPLKHFSSNQMTDYGLKKLFELGKMGSDSSESMKSKAPSDIVLRLKNIDPASCPAHKISLKQMTHSRFNKVNFYFPAGNVPVGYQDSKSKFWQTGINVFEYQPK